MRGEMMRSLLALLVACGSTEAPAPMVAPPPEPVVESPPADPVVEAPVEDPTARVLLAAATRAPDFLAQDQTGARRTLSEHRGKPVVLYFYPRDATPGCTAEACAFRDAWQRFERAGVIVYGVSTDDVESHRRFAEEHELPFPLLADPDQTILRRYGVPARDGAASRVTFLIDRAGAIAQVFPEVDPGAHADQVLEAAAALPADALRTRIATAVAARDRTADDRALDAGRRPEETLAFFGVREGNTVAELFAGGGYTAELLARVVGNRGRVFGQNTPAMLERFAEAPWSTRLRKRVMSRVVRADRELDDPLPPEAQNLDLVLFVLAYHDSAWMGTDRAAMNRAIFNALRPGGVYGIVDHAAAEGHGVADAQTLHRIERSVLVSEIEAAGFVLTDEGFFLANPDDPRDWNASPREAADRRGTSDRFVLRFERPAQP
jgi:predicted methyltransferase/peroxiredoxin